MLVGIVGKEGWLIDVDEKVGRASQWSESGRTYLPSLRAYERFDLWKYVSSLPTITMWASWEQELLLLPTQVRLSVLPPFLLDFFFTRSNSGSAGRLKQGRETRGRFISSFHLLSLQFCLSSSGNSLSILVTTLRELGVYIGRSEDLESNTYRLINRVITC